MRHRHRERCGPPHHHRWHHGHGHHHGPPWHRGHGHGRPRSLQRLLFWWFGAAIVLTMLVAALVSKLASGGSPWQEQASRMSRFAAGRFERVWDQPAARSDLAESIARDLELHVVVRDADGRVLSTHGRSECHGPDYTVAVERAGRALGEVEACPDDRHLPRAWLPIAIVLAAGFVLWGLSGRVARRLTRPLGRVSEVARDLGEGKLDSRVELGRRTTDEVRVVAETINEMADRVQKQVEDSRELLAAVSHEMRTPLARLRVLSELARSGNVDADTIDGIEREVLEMDALIGQLLASSRLEFDALSFSELSAPLAAAEALERADLPVELLEDESDGATFPGDATLVARALANLLDNAREHGGGIVRLLVSGDDAHVRFTVEDGGPGFPSGSPGDAFEPFRGTGGPRADGSASLGLGLALVQRIARAHGGEAEVQNRDSGGAAVSFTTSRASEAEVSAP